ncbi:MAG: MBL fold metallo-hydrolase, partial [bacterium]
MEIVTWTIGPMDNNVYLLKNGLEKSIVVDPAWDDDFIVNEAASKHKPIGMIILTHGHLDHCLSAAYVKEKTGAELWVHELDEHYLSENEKKAKYEFGLDFTATTADKTFTDGDVIKWGDDEI